MSSRTRTGRHSHEQTTSDGPCTVSIDGYSSGPDGPAGDSWLHEHALRPATGEYFEGIWRGCDTALLGRTN